MELDFQLCLDTREDARVFATVILVPEVAGLLLDGVAVQLFDADGESLSSKLLLPVSGELVGPVSSRVELRCCRGDIPAGSEVRATAWWPGGMLQARRTADPGTTLEAHVLAVGSLAMTDGDVLLDLLPEERDVMLAHFPWVIRPSSAGALQLDAEPTAQDLEDDLGLDDADAEWLKDLMNGGL